MNLTVKKLISIALSFIASFTILASGFSANVEAKNNGVITSTLNIAEARKNLEGPGYSWANRDSELTLKDLYIDTEDGYGLRLPKDCTVILKGKNYIKASKYGVSCSGTVAFKGDGTLLIDAGEAGIYLISQNNTHKIRILNGNYTINAGKYGVLSEYADFSFVGKSMSVHVDDENGFAIKGRCVNLTGGSFVADAAVSTTQELVVDSIDINISAASAALTSPQLRIENINIEGLEEYNGEFSIVAKATKRFKVKSIIFGENVPGYVDYIFLAVAAILIAAAVVFPILHKKKKNKILYERLKTEGYLS